MIQGTMIKGQSMGTIGLVWNSQRLRIKMVMNSSPRKVRFRKIVLGYNSSDQENLAMHNWRNIIQDQEKWTEVVLLADTTENIFINIQILEKNRHFLSLFYYSNIFCKPN